MAIDQTEPQGMDAAPYYQLLHTMLRHDGSDEECTRANKAIEWLHVYYKTLNTVSTNAEKGVTSAIYEYWSRYGNAPDRNSLDTLIRGHEQHQTLLDLLGEYDLEAPTLVATSH